MEALVYGNLSGERCTGVTPLNVPAVHFSDPLSSIRQEHGTGSTIAGTNTPAVYKMYNAHARIIREYTCTSVYKAGERDEGATPPLHVDDKRVCALRVGRCLAHG